MRRQRHRRTGLCAAFAGLRVLPLTTCNPGTRRSWPKGVGQLCNRENAFPSELENLFWLDSFKQAKVVFLNGGRPTTGSELAGQTVFVQL